MKALNNFEESKKKAAYKGSSRLPVGGYVAKIKDVRYEEGKEDNSDMIILAYDIAEGEHKDFFKNQFDNNTQEDKKWKGRTTIYVPKDDGSERDEWTKTAFARWTNAFEDSNKGYVWDWDEKKWKGKMIGLIYGEVGTVIDGKPIEYTECRFPESVEKVRSGDFKIPAFKARKGYDEAIDKQGDEERANDKGFMNIPDTIDEELPF